MNPALAHFNQLLEQYAFKIASHQIGGADPATQTALITFWQTLNKETTANGPAPDVSSPQSTEWEAVLHEPINWRSVNQQWIQGIIRERSQCHREYLVRLSEAIEATRTRLLSLEDSVYSESSRARLTAHYRQTLLMYQQQLTKARHLQAIYFAHLSAGMP
ncbi:hypothetical protein [Spirosoma rhododendri]|uniref:Uncharacterized protein n=1 Tax=Spirosoma rhododendri TaxID=2728024 RepID=A0A7L5DNH4_9BACT|nr:hypothetical protein [Spirosoma rhododendri]QJD79956.1 hypothetical protein HH216_17215 [Spirosoma rhododendri]